LGIEGAGGLAEPSVSRAWSTSHRRSRLPWWSAGLNVVSMNKEAQLDVTYGFAPDLADPRGLLVPQL